MAFISSLFRVSLRAERVFSGAMTHLLPGAVLASTVFPPPGASEENGLPHTSARTQLPQSMKIMHEIMYKLEVLYVLCVLLMGRQRNQVGTSLASQNRGSQGQMLPGLWYAGCTISLRLEWHSL